MLHAQRVSACSMQVQSLITYIYPEDFSRHRVISTVLYLCTDRLTVLIDLNKAECPFPRANALFSKPGDLSSTLKHPFPSSNCLS